MTKWIKKYLLRTAGGLLVVAVMSLHSLEYLSIGLVQTLDNLIYDSQVRVSANRGPDEKIVILDIDEKSLGSSKLGRWPWSRDKLAAILDTLFDQYKIKILAFDVVFAEPDNSSGLATLKTLATTSLKDSVEFTQTLTRISKDLDYDQKFAQSLRGRPVILGFYFNAAPGTPTSGELPFPVLLEDDFKGTHADMPSWGGFGSNLSSFVSVATLSGHFNPIVDSDGSVRRVPLFVRYEKDYYESLALAIARLNQGLRTVGSAGELRLPPVSVSPRMESNRGEAGLLPTLDSVSVGVKQIRTDSATNVLVPYRGGPKTFKYISLIDVLEGKVPKESLSGKIAIVGTTAPGLVDLRATPVSGIYPGVEVHANLASALISDDPSAVLKSLPSDLVFYEFLAIVVLGGLIALVMPMLSPAYSTGLFFSGIVGLFGMVQWMWSEGTVFPVASLILVLVVLYLWNSGYGFLVESRQKRQFTNLFGQYVPPELVKKMAEDPDKYSMKGRKETLTVLFSDVAGFTSISERLSPTDLAEFINEYLTSMSAIIRDHGGTLDKYIGDAIMAFWGAPVSEPRHAEQAARAALAMQVRVAELNEVFSKRGWPDLRIGIGLSTGQMTVGDMGSQVRRAYTVMGDAVNLGSRLEGLTRMYANKILCSEETYQSSFNTVVYREIDRVRVKGKDVPVTIYEPLCPVGECVKIGSSEAMEDWASFLESYRAQNWPAARDVLQKLADEFPEEGLYRAYRERMKTLEAQNLGHDWDGVTNFESK